MAHENRHRLTNKYPELNATQPTWTGIEEGMSRMPGGFKKMGDEYWRNEAFNRFMDYQYYPDVSFEGQTRGWYPRGMSSPNLGPTDMYFDKIWRDKWTPHVKDYNKTLETIAQNTKKPTQINQGGGNGGGGYQPTTTAQNRARTASRVGPGGNVKAYGLADGGLIDLYRYGGFI